MIIIKVVLHTFNIRVLFLTGIFVNVMGLFVKSGGGALKTMHVPFMPYTTEVWADSPNCIDLRYGDGSIEAVSVYYREIVVVVVNDCR